MYFYTWNTTPYVASYSGYNRVFTSMLPYDIMYNDEFLTVSSNDYPTTNFIYYSLNSNPYFYRLFFLPTSTTTLAYYRYYYTNTNFSSYGFPSIFKSTVSQSSVFFTDLGSSQISGKYRFNSNVSTTNRLANSTINVNVSINNVPYRNIYFNNIGTTKYSWTHTYAPSGNYSWGVGGMHVAVSYDYASLYSSSSAINEPSDFTQIIDSYAFLNSDDVVWDFGDTPQEVPTPFYNWVTSNASYVYPNTYTIKSYTGSVQLAELAEAPPMTSGILSTTGNTHYLTLTGSNDVNYTLNWTSTKVPTDGQFLGLGYKINQGIADYKTGSTFDIDWENSLTLYEQYGTPSQDYTKFDVNLYHNNAENIVLDKTGYLTSVGMLSGALRENCDLYRPSILVELPELPTFNYCYIGILNRYYYVESIQSVRYTLWQVNLKCDVLMTYKTQLLGLNAFVARSASHYNPYITDKQLPMRPEPECEILIDHSDLTDITVFDVTSNDVTCPLYIAVVNTGEIDFEYDTGSTGYNVIPSTNFLPWTGSGVVLYKIVGLQNIFNVLSNILNDSTKISQVISMCRIPFLIPDEALYHSGKFVMGDISIDEDSTSGGIYDVWNGKASTNYAGAFTKTFEITRRSRVLSDAYGGDYNKYLDYEPYTKIELYIPYYGWVNIPTSIWTPELNTLQIRFVYDVLYGLCSFTITGGAGNLIVADTIDYGGEISITYTNTEDVKRQRMTNIINAISSILGGITSAGSSALTGAISGAAFGGIGAGAGAILGLATSLPNLAGTVATSALNYISSEINNVPTGGIYKVSDSVGKMFTPNYIMARYTWYKPTFDLFDISVASPTITNDYTEYIKLKGLPYCKTVQLSELSGIAYINDIHLENFSTALDEEKNDIATSLANGVIFPEQETAEETSEDDVS